MTLPYREIRLTSSTNKLYFFDRANMERHFMLNIGAKKREGFTDSEVKGTRRDLWYLCMFSFPLERDFEDMVHSKMIIKCPVTHRNIVNAKKIFGPDVKYLKGKPVRPEPVSVVRDYVKIPQDILKSRKNMELSTNICLLINFHF